MIARTLRMSLVVLALAASLGCGTHKEEARHDSSSSQTQWVDVTRLRPGPIVQDSLEAGQVARIRTLQQTFTEVDSNSFDRWVQDFRRDQDPEREIRIYEAMAKAYSAYCTGRRLTPAMKRDVYGILLLRSGAPDDEVLAHLQLQALSIEDARDVLKLYKGAPEPIEFSDSPGR